MKNILLATMLMVSASASATELSAWSVDNDCVASSAVDWPTSTGYAIMAYDVGDNTVNIGIVNEKWDFKEPIEEEITIVLGAKYKIGAIGHGVPNLNMLILEIPHSVEFEKNFTTQDRLVVYSLEGNVILNVELYQIDDAVEKIYSCHIGRKS